jgi:hypothetical protein
MDAVMGSNVSKDYPKMDNALKKVGNQIAYSPDTNIQKKSETLPPRIDPNLFVDRRAEFRPSSIDK